MAKISRERLEIQRKAKVTKSNKGGGGGYLWVLGFVTVKEWGHKKEGKGWLGFFEDLQMSKTREMKGVRDFKVFPIVCKNNY
jgi:hypothetical protein